MSFFESNTPSPKKVMTTNGLSVNDQAVLIDPSQGLTYHGVIKRHANGIPYVLCSEIKSTEETWPFERELPLTPDWQLNPSVFYSEENVRKIVNLWGFSDVGEALKSVIPDVADLLQPGDEYHARGVAKKVKDTWGLESAQNRILFNILSKADKVIVKDSENEIHIFDLPAGEAKRYTLEPSVVKDNEWVILNGDGHLVGPKLDSFEEAQEVLDVLNERGPIGLTHPLPPGFTTVEIPTGPWSVVHSTGWVTEPGWQGESEVEAITNFQEMNPGLFLAETAGQGVDSSVEMMP